MARPVSKKRAKRMRGKDRELPLSGINYKLLILGVGIILAGYLFMLEGSVDGMMPIVIAPILLIIGYCIIIPFAILYRGRKKSYSGSDTASSG